MVSFERLSRMYSGRTAKSYEHDRIDGKWFAELRAVDELLTFVRKGSKTLDAPIGTGRFLRFYAARKLEVHGIDVSHDMLAQAQAAAELLGMRIELGESDIRALPFPDGCFDLVICIRFLNLIRWQQVCEVVRELTRVSSDKLLFGIRYVASYSDFRIRFGDLVMLTMRLLNVVRFRSKRRRALVHDKAALLELMKESGLEVLHSREVQRRWDGTIYVMLLCQKTT